MTRMFSKPLIALLSIAVSMWLGFAKTAASQKRDGGIVLIDQYQTPGSISELSGISPHPTDDTLYFVLANKNPAYSPGQQSRLPEQYRGKLLTVNRHTGKIVRSFGLVDGDYGGLAFGDGFLFAAISREPAEILKVNPSNGSVVGRIPVSGPIGGLEYDNDRSILLAQIFRDIPHIAVINPRTGRTQETMWSDESAMGLAKVQGDLLCSWASGFDQHAFGDLRLLDPATGRVRGRLRTNEILTAMAPLSKKVAGIDGFIALTVLDPLTGAAAVRKYSYQKSLALWAQD